MLKLPLISTPGPRSASFLAPFLVWANVLSASIGYVTNWAIESAKTLLARLDTHLQSLDFLVGNRLTVADITGFHTLRYAERVGIDIKSYENIYTWLYQLEKRPGFQEST